VIVASILTPIENALTSLLEWFHTTIGLSWGWSIIALVVLVRIAILPLAVRQIHSMQNLQAHAPEMKAIQQKWKHDRQRQNEELMKFYKENKINPAASCLPIVPQIPIFMSLFFVLRDFEKEVWTPNYSGSSLEWLGLVDITEKTIKGWGPLLIVIYAASQLTSSFYMSTTMQSKAQRYMIMVLPIAFIPFVLNFASGLMLYWMTTNLWTTGQGIVTRRLVPKIDPGDLAKRSSRTPVKAEPAAPANARVGARQPKVPPASGSTHSAGPPRRVRRKRGGGGAKR
jgi:YidC/Oxa1 family membrane protein insertase